MAAVLALALLLLSSSAHAAPKAVAPAMPKAITPAAAKIGPMAKPVVKAPMTFAVPPGAFVGTMGPKAAPPAMAPAMAPEMPAPTPAPAPARVPDLIYVQWTGNVTTAEANRTVTCIVGDSLVFGSAKDLSLYQMASEAAYMKCDFTKAILIKDWKVPQNLYRYRKEFNTTGDFYYASKAALNATASGSKKTTGCAQGLKVHVSVIEEPEAPAAAPSGAAASAVRGVVTVLSLAVAIAFSFLA